MKRTGSIQTQMRHHAKQELVNRIFNGLWMVIEGRNGREDRSSGQGQQAHVFQMDETEWRVANHENQFPSLF